MTPGTWGCAQETVLCPTLGGLPQKAGVRARQPRGSGSVRHAGEAVPTTRTPGTETARMEGCGAEMKAMQPGVLAGGVHGDGGMGTSRWENMGTEEVGEYGEVCCF